jgi:hypothetical protein
MDPSKRWLLWISFLALVAMFILIALFAGAIKETGWEWLVAIGGMAAIIFTFRPVKQRVEITCEGTFIGLMLTVNMLGRVDMHFRSRENSIPQHVKLGFCSQFRIFPLRASVWFEHLLKISGRPRRLLIYYHFPNGFTVGLVDDTGVTPFTVMRNEFCF